MVFYDYYIDRQKMLPLAESGSIQFTGLARKKLKVNPCSTKSFEYLRLNNLILFKNELFDDMVKVRPCVHSRMKWVNHSRASVYA